MWGSLELRYGQPIAGGGCPYKLNSGIALSVKLSDLLVQRPAIIERIINLKIPTTPIRRGEEISNGR